PPRRRPSCPSCRCKRDRSGDGARPCPAGGPGLCSRELQQSRRATFLSCLCAGALVQNLLDASDVLTGFPEQARVLELPREVLHAVGEQVLFPARLERDQVFGRALPQVLRLHHVSPRARNRVSMGSFEAASLNASRASFSGTPWISNSTRPGLTTATQPS